MIKFRQITDRELGAILVSRNVVGVSNRTFDYTANFSPKSYIGIPHEVLTLRTDELTLQGLNDSQKSLRVVESVGGKPSALYSLSSENDAPHVMEILTDEKSTLNFLRTYDFAYTRYNNQSAFTELAFIRVPAILCEVIWVKSIDGTDDKFIPIKSVGNLKEMEEYSKDEFLAHAKNLALRLEEQKDNEGS